MRYWFTIKDAVPEDVARVLWDNISRYNANLTLLPDRLYVYGETDEPSVLEKIAKAIVATGYPAERG
jgi:hypothetical protein